MACCPARRVTKTISGGAKKRTGGVIVPIPLDTRTVVRGAAARGQPGHLVTLSIAASERTSFISAARPSNVLTCRHLFFGASLRNPLGPKFGGAVARWKDAFHQGGKCVESQFPNLVNRDPFDLVC